MVEIALNGASGSAPEDKSFLRRFFSKKRLLAFARVT